MEKENTERKCNKTGMESGGGRASADEYFPNFPPSLLPSPNTQERSDSSVVTSNRNKNKTN